MTETTPAAAAAAAPAKFATFREILESLTGKVITMVNPESYEDAPVGHRLTTGFYKAKIVTVGEDFMTVATEYVHRGDQSKEPVRQFIPLANIKRISVMKGERIIHL